MSSIVEKVKETLHMDSAHKKHDDHQPENPHSTNHGPHGSNFLNKADPRVDSDRDGSKTYANKHQTTTTYPSATSAKPGHHHGAVDQRDSLVSGTHYGSSAATSGTHGTHHTTGAVPHDSKLLNEMDPRVQSNQVRENHQSNNPKSSNYGPHGSNVMNAMDPRVDSDLDGSYTMGNSATTTGDGGPQGYTRDTHATSHVGHAGHNTHEQSIHNSSLVNKADPRIDSDMDGSRNIGMAQTSTSAGMLPHGTHGHNTTSHTHAHSQQPTHNSNILNKMDPRVDSDRDGSRNMGMAQTSGTALANHSHDYTHGHAAHGHTHALGHGHQQPAHNSSALNKLDPRVDSDADGSRNMGMAQTSTIQNQYNSEANLGPVHNSKLLNKLDPRVHHQAVEATQGHKQM